MAKALHADRPTSSIARLLDPASARRAIEPVPERTPRTHAPADERASPTAGGRARHSRRHESTHLKRELVLSPNADETFNRLIEALRRSTGTRLTASHAFRALMRAMQPAINVMTQGPRRPMRLPSNAPAFEEDRARFESDLAALIEPALRTPRTPPSV